MKFKSILIISFLIITQSAYANCKIFLFATTPMKENEKSLFYEASFAGLKKKSYILTNHLKDADYLASFSLAPQVKDNEFIFVLRLKIEAKNKDIFEESVDTQNLKAGFDRLFEEIPGCVE